LAEGIDDQSLDGQRALVGRFTGEDHERPPGKKGGWDRDAGARDTAALDRGSRQNRLRVMAVTGGPCYAAQSREWQRGAQVYRVAGAPTVRRSRAEPVSTDMISYAQNFEDVMLARVFRDRTDGFYVDVGAGDPVNMSVTKWFYDLGWRGINIEPNPTLHARLTTERTRDINLDCAAGAFAGEAQYFQLPVNELSSCDPRVRARAEAAGEPITVRAVRVMPLTEILDRHCGGGSIDFLKIDVEGWERQVLSGLDWRRYRPTVVVVEATLPNTRVASHAEWEELLIGSGYRHVHFDGLSRFYIPGERTDLEAHFQLPPNIFDDFKTWQQVATEEALAATRSALAERGRAVAATEEALTATRSALAERERAVAATEEALAATEEALAATEEALAATKDALAATKDALTTTRSALAERERNLARLRDEVEGLRKIKGEMRTIAADLRQLLGKTALGGAQQGQTGIGRTGPESDEVDIDSIRGAVRTLASLRALSRHTIATGLRRLRERLAAKGP
jgi:FkbM family methyltransferase